MTMPFGKYKGCHLSELPDDYLEWLIGEFHPREPLLSYLKMERQWRVPAPASMMEIVSVGYRTLAIKYHPDKGGSNEQMKSLNNSADALRKMIKGENEFH